MFSELSFFYNKNEKFTYTGDELKPHFNFMRYGLKGSSLSIACGPCEVQNTELVDLQDQKEGEFIKSTEMIHFLGEFYGLGIKEGVFLQCYFISVFKDLLNLEFGENKVKQSGNDLFIDDKKLSVSIVAPSIGSVLMHFGVNINSKGAPVSAVGLSEYKVDSDLIISKFIAIWEKEWKRLSFACTKVRSVV